MSYSLSQKAFAWFTHAFTASGLVAAFLAILAIDAQDWRWAMIWLIVCLIIDGVDGTFARASKVKEVLPHMDGKTIDYVIDFATYAIIPSYLFYKAAQAGAIAAFDDNVAFGCVVVMLIVSALYYGRMGMVTDDMYFLGFPVLWNMVVFYMIFVFTAPAWLNVAAVLFFAVLHFVPIKFVYPSQQTRAKGPTIAVTVVFLVANLAILWLYPEVPSWLELVSILTVLYYGAMAVYDTYVLKV